MSKDVETKKKCAQTIDNMVMFALTHAKWCIYKIVAKNLTTCKVNLIIGISNVRKKIIDYFKPFIIVSPLSWVVKI